MDFESLGILWKAALLLGNISGDKAVITCAAMCICSESSDKWYFKALSDF